MVWVTHISFCKLFLTMEVPLHLNLLTLGGFTQFLNYTPTKFRYMYTRTASHTCITDLCLQTT